MSIASQYLRARAQPPTGSGIAVTHMERPLDVLEVQLEMETTVLDAESKTANITCSLSTSVI